ncbi:MAG: type IV secretory system conjugative DNA transfer family protein [Catenulispora sp.]|nr:type IV secretory system conjugative DNA transfer family protein [Catenulispora sp.]
MSMRSPRPVHPSGQPGGYPLTPWIITGGVVALYALAWLSWLAGRLAAMLHGLGFGNGPGFDMQFVGGILAGDWATLWPGVPASLVAIVYGSLLTLIFGPVIVGLMWWSARRPQSGDPLPSLAREHDVAALLPKALAVKAQRLRPGLAGVKPRQIKPEDTGIAIGTLITRSRRKPVLRMGFEDVALAFMAPRTGKTTSLAIPPIMQAAGSVLATSNRSDLWAATWRHRAKLGDTFNFDPQGITFTEQQFWIDPLAAVRTVEAANRLADHFAQEVRSGAGDVFWPLAASELLSALILAAAVSRGSLADVQLWLTDPAARQPVIALRNAGFIQSARSISSAQNGAPETRDSIYQTARTAARCLIDPQIMAWVTPPKNGRLPRFDPTRFALTRDTIYLHSKEGAGAAAPLLAGIVDQIFRYGVRQAEAAGGRLPDPMLPVLDEAANICKISDLPLLYSHLGGRGINPITILQNIAQGKTVWGEQGMDALWSAATIKIIGAGLDDARHAEDLSKLVGVHDVTLTSSNRDHQGYSSWSTSIQERRILEPGAIRSIKTGRALLLATGSKVAMIELLPWYEGLHADAIAADQKASVETITSGAQSSLDLELPEWKGI